MRWGRVGRLLLLVAPVVLGLLVMHALVAPGGSAVHASTPAHGTVVHHGASASGADTHGDTSTSAGGGAASVPAGHSALDHLLHLCLAVLAALATVVAGARVLLGTTLGAAPLRCAAARFGPAPAGRPPPVPRRLALLCVLRN